MFTNVIQVIIVAYLNNIELCLVTFSFFVYGLISPVPFLPVFPVIASFCGY